MSTPTDYRTWAVGEVREFDAATNLGVSEVRIRKNDRGEVVAYYRTGDPESIHEAGTAVRYVHATSPYITRLPIFADGYDGPRADDLTAVSANGNVVRIRRDR